MPVVAWWLVAGGVSVLFAGLGVDKAGEGIEEAGNGTLKIAGAALIGAAAYVAVKKGVR